MSATITAHLPEQLLDRADRLVQAGWATDLDAILTDALSRYLDSHTEALTESFIREDVEWGLHGRD